MLESMFVGLIVIAAAGYAVWSLVPGPVRLAWARQLGAWGGVPGRAAWIARCTGAVERTAAARPGGCSGCSSGGPAEPKQHELPPR